jgi:LYR motif-containing protein 4
MYSDALKESTVLTRSAAVNQLYGGWKLAVELETRPEAIEIGAKLKGSLS